MRISNARYMMNIAHAVAVRSACLNRQVGCVLVDKHRHVLSTGYNGVPSGIDHCAMCHRKESGRDLYACSAVHAEMNAMLQCRNTQKIVIAYITISPCMICARLLANTSCQTVVFDEFYTQETGDEFIKFWSRLNRKVIYLRGIQ